MPIALGIIIIGAALLAVGAVVWSLIELSGEDYKARHQASEPGPDVPRLRSGPRFGAIPVKPVAGKPPWQTSCFPPPEEWNPANAATGADWEHRTALWNGHTFGCLQPDEDHPGACPEEGDWPDERSWPVPDMPPAGQLDIPAGPDVINAVLALEEGDPENAGWTDQLLADLREAPTSLDRGRASCGHPFNDDGECDCAWWPERAPIGSAPDTDPWEIAERMADTGEIQLASLRADYAADLSTRDADVAEYKSRLASQAAEIRLFLFNIR